MNNTTIQEGESKISSFIKRITQHEKTIEIIGSIIAIVVAAYPIINYVHNLSYQSDCEQFYNVPGKYFNDSIGKNIVFIVLLIVLMFFAIAPAIMRKYGIKRELKQRLH